MHHFLHSIYNLFVPNVLYLVFVVGRFFNAKLRAGYQGRTQPINAIDKTEHEKIFVFHCASLGEWEQAIPVLEAVKSKWPHVRCFASFFSPSGYNRAKHLQLDGKYYLPIDSNKKTLAFLEALSPDYFLFSAYDVWPNLILNCKKMNIQTGLFSATLPASSLRFKFPLRLWNGYIYDKLDFIGTRAEDDLSRMKKIYRNNQNLFVSGDTRIERVMERKSLAKPIEPIEKFVNHSDFVIVLGSSWPEDEANIIDSCISFLTKHTSSKLILAPHELNKNHINRLISVFEKHNLKAILFDQLDPKNAANQILILNTIGILAETYQYANTVFVGGSFKKAVHNILEPAVYNIPVIIGPKHKNSQEAIDLIKAGSVFNVHSNAEFGQILAAVWEGKIDVREVANINLQYFEKNKGASLKVLNHLD